MDAHGIGELAHLHRRAIDDPAWFWHAVLTDLGIAFSKPYEKVLDTSPGVPWTRWCVGGELNIASNCIDKWTGTSKEHSPAIRWTAEEGTGGMLTYGELAQQVHQAANALRRLGLAEGDVIGICMPMTPEIAAAFFAVITIGAIALPLFSGYGADPIATRLVDAGAKALITADGARRRGRTFPIKPIVDEAARRVPSLEHIVVVRRTGEIVEMRPGRDAWWHEIVPAESVECAAARTAAEDPFMLIYTSGTTGKPKGAVHTHCGFPIKAAQDLQHGFDMRGDDTIFWITDLGWMMGPWELLGATLLGATFVLYDGAMDYPTSNRVWELVAEHRATILGISPTLVRMMMRAPDSAPEIHDLSSLRILGSTGEPWNPDPWWWLFDTVGKRTLPIINYSGGTEISGGIISGNVLTALKPCAFAGPLPGMDADVVDADGRPVRGAVGELVIRAPWIGMCRGFWNDPDRYLDTYWSRFPNVWVHGDWALIDEDGQWFIFGRSDDTLKIAGKRVGPAEIESTLVAHPAVAEAAAVGVPDHLKGERLVCVCVPAAGAHAGPALEQELTAWVRKAMGPALTPDAIVFLDQLPKTRNGKVMRRVIRAVYAGDDPGDLSALDNAGVLDELRGKA
jgi:acetyl-CoA synthetase